MVHHPPRGPSAIPALARSAQTLGLMENTVGRQTSTKAIVIVPGCVDEYIQGCPEKVRSLLIDIRSAVQSAAPGSTETTSYFDMPGYCYVGYDYNGMFAWFSFKSPNVRLHVRPPVLENHAADLNRFATTKAIVSFPVSERIPRALVKKLVKASITEMKRKARAAAT
jgi:uncharacterized protein YdhG (YjbR/CyaY superfamily)